ncbi:Serine threonine protein [Apiospora sp. TS-2023a]
MGTDGHGSIKGADSDDKLHDGEPQRGRGRNKLSPTLQIPKNRSTGNLAVVTEDTESLDRQQHESTSRVRFSFDAGSGLGADYDSVTRSSLITDHDHGLGLSGLRRIRQHQPMRTPTLPSSAASSRSPSAGIPRSSSMISMMPSGLSSGPASPSFTEDLSRFPSESLHSFSFAHQSEDFIHNRQNVLKRSIEFMRDKMGWAAASNAAMASAQARLTGDVETQSMLDLLAKAQLVGAGNLSSSESAFVSGALTGPAEVSGENVFEQDFIPRTSSPDTFLTPMVSPAGSRTRVEESGAETPAKANNEQDSKPLGTAKDQTDSEASSRTPTNESAATATTAKTSPPCSRKPSLKRTYTDVAPVSMQQKLMDAMAQPFVQGQAGSTISAYPEALLSPALSSQPAFNGPPGLGSAVHGHSTRWVPAAQAIFTTEAKPPWTIVAANDLACLVFGVTKAEVRKMGILEVVQEERRACLDSRNSYITTAYKWIQFIRGSWRYNCTVVKQAKFKSAAAKAPSRRAQTVHSGDTTPSKPRVDNSHGSSKSRGVLLCGDVVPIQKRNGATGSASLWVKEKRIGLIWVLEEIHEDVAFLTLDEEGTVVKIKGETGPLFGDEMLQPGMDVGRLIPRIPRQGIDPRYGAIDYAQIERRRYFTCRNSGMANIPATIHQTQGEPELRVSSFPHIAGIVVVEPDEMKIKSSNSVFCGALFGYEKSEGLPINTLIPDFDRIVRILIEQEGVDLHDGIVIPEHSFRKAAAFHAVRDGRPDAATNFLNPEGLPAKHRDGTSLKIDVQMRVVKSERQSGHDSGASDDESSPIEETITAHGPEIVYALWITYSRHLHAPRTTATATGSPFLSASATPLHQPSPGQTAAPTPQDVGSDSDEPRKQSTATNLAQQLKEVAKSAAAKITGTTKSEPPAMPAAPVPQVVEPPHGKKSIDDFVILEEMGQGAYGQVKLARYKYGDGRKVVLKYVTKRRILVDTWTRDRRLGTVPLEIHVLDYLGRDGLKHPNIQEMEDFFEDDINYYIEMVPHGLPGMDLFDYIELRANMEEDECRSIFVQVAKAIHHLHIKAKVVHRDIKDENVILDGEGHIKLIDFGSAAYIKSGPFDVFVGTIDYAAPEVLAGKPYGGKEQDVWALGILLYTIIYKENPFYSIDEIMDRDLRVPYTISDESIDLIRCMLNRDVSQRYDITQVLDHPWCQMNE